MNYRLFNSIKVAAAIANILPGKWDGCNAIVCDREVDEAAFSSAIAKVAHYLSEEVEFCRSGDSCRSNELEQAIVDSLDIKWLIQFVDVELPPHREKLISDADEQKVKFCHLALNRLLHLNCDDAMFYLYRTVQNNQRVAEECIFALSNCTCTPIVAEIEVCQNPFWGKNAVYLLEDIISNSSLFCNDTGVKGLLANIVLDLYKGRFGSETLLEKESCYKIILELRNCPKFLNDMTPQELDYLKKRVARSSSFEELEEVKQHLIWVIERTQAEKKCDRSRKIIFYSFFLIFLGISLLFFIQFIYGK